ncbi:hypothetical protein [Zunongwangia sp.]|uniref:hypothetical protein n=1 Tax=Zunongwangia sp. TaxID=1965325 RepID=UPI003AA91C36
MRNYYFYFMIYSLFSCFISCTPDSIEEYDNPILNKDKEIQQRKQNNQENDEKYYLEDGEGDQLGNPFDRGK